MAPYIQAPIYYFLTILFTLWLRVLFFDAACRSYPTFSTWKFPQISCNIDYNPFHFVAAGAFFSMQLVVATLHSLPGSFLRSLVISITILFTLWLWVLFFDAACRGYPAFSTWKFPQISCNIFLQSSSLSGCGCFFPMQLVVATLHSPPGSFLRSLVRRYIASTSVKHHAFKSTSYFAAAGFLIVANWL